MKSSILARSVQGVFGLVLFAHCFTTVHEWGSVSLPSLADICHLTLLFEAWGGVWECL